MSRRTRLKKNKRMREFISKYWCQVGKHLVPANKNGWAITAEAYEIEWDEGRPPSNAFYTCCDEHLTIADLVRYTG